MKISKFYDGKLFSFLFWVFAIAMVITIAGSTDYFLNISTIVTTAAILIWFAALFALFSKKNKS